MAEHKDIDAANEKGDDNINGPNDRVLIQNMDHRILWYITDKVLDKQSYISCTFSGDKQREFPLVGFFTSKEPKLEIYYAAFPDIKYYKDKYFFMRMYTNIYKKGEYIKEEITHKTYTGTQTGSRKYTKYGFQFTKYSVVNVVDAVSNTWHINYDKENFYSEIALSFIGKLFSEINLTISPYVCICTIKAVWSHLADHMKYRIGSKPIKILTQMLEERVTAQDVSTMSNWTQASEILSSVGAIMSINGTRSKAKLSPIDDDVLLNVYTRITDPKVFGSMKNILKHIEFMYVDWIPNFQTLCWMMQTEYPGIRQYNYLLWYNLLCCIKADVDGAKRTRIASERNSITTLDLEKLFVLDNRLNKFNQPHPFAKKKRKIIMKSRNATIQDCISAINDITDINGVYDFIQRYKNEINSMLEDNTDLYITFASEIFNRLLKSKQKNAQKTQELQQVIIDLLKKQMQNMRTQNEVQTFYEFYTKHRQFMIDSGIDDTMLTLDIFVQCKDFIPIFAPLLQSDDDRCYERLRKCTLLWLKAFQLSQTVQILRDNGLNEQILSDIYGINIDKLKQELNDDFRDKITEHKQTIDTLKTQHKKEIDAIQIKNNALEEENRRKEENKHEYIETLKIQHKKEIDDMQTKIYDLEEENRRKDENKHECIETLKMQHKKEIDDIQIKVNAFAEDEDDNKHEYNVNNNVKKQFKSFLNECNMDRYFDTFVANECCNMQSIQYFDDEFLANDIGIKNKIVRKTFLKECSRMTILMDEFERNYGITSVIYSKLKKYGIVTVPILCEEVQTAQDLQSKFNITNDHHCELLLKIVQKEDGIIGMDPNQQLNDDPNQQREGADSGHFI